MIMALTALTILGTWQYTGLRMDGRFFPGSRGLIVQFRFDEAGISHLVWRNEGEQTFCERRASYSVSGENLWQKIFWVNPNNSPTCASDPDMQLGRESTTRFYVSGPEMGFYLSLNGDTVIYVLEKVSPAKIVDWDKMAQTFLANRAIEN